MGKTYCPKCGKQRQDNLCPACDVCPKCKEPMAAGSLYCEHCGKPKIDTIQLILGCAGIAAIVLLLIAIWYYATA